MSILCGYASISETKSKNGKPGDQTGLEIKIGQYYNFGQDRIIRFKDSNKAIIAAIAVRHLCENDSFGYGQRDRKTSFDVCKSINWDVSRIKDIKILCNSDCSELMALAINFAYGKEIIPHNAYTGNLESLCSNTGYFETIRSINETDIKVGDMILKPGKHVIMALEGYSNDKGETSNAVKVKKGIDVSGHNVITDYSAVKNEGVEFAVVKIIRKDGNMDNLFIKHITGFKTVNIPIIGVYNYSYATTVEMARNYAQKVVQYLKQVNLQNTTVWFDSEDNVQKGLGINLINIINEYQKIIEENGYGFGLYTGLSFYNSYIRPFVNQLNCKRFWIARYPSGSEMKLINNPDVNKKPPIGKEIEAWQYSSKGIMKGINGFVDLDILYK